MGRGITEITMAQLAGVVGTYSNVIWMNDPTDSDLVKTIIGQPRTLIINLAQFLNIASGDIQGDAIALDEIEATEIAAGAVGTSELATDALAASAAGRLKMATGYFNAAALLDKVAASAVVGSLIDNNAVGFPYGIAAQSLVHDGGAVELLAADATIDRVVTVIVIGTEAGDGTVELDIGAAGGNELFDDLAAGSWAIGERYVGTIVLPASSALDATFNVVGGTGELNAYVLTVTPLVQTAQIANLAVTDGKLASSLVKDVGILAHGVLRVTGVCADGQQVVIGSDTFEIDPIQTDLGDDTQGGEWSNTTDPLTVDINVGNYPNLQGVLIVGELILIETEYMRVTAIGGGAGDEVTFERGAGGSTTATHADANNILTSAATPAATNIPVGVAADFSAGVVTPILAATINEDAGTAGQANAVDASDILGTGAIMLITADAVGNVVLATTETHGNGVWDATTMRRGVAAAVRQQASLTIVPDSEEVTSGDIYVPLPFAPAVVLVHVITTSGGAIVQWTGNVEIVAASGVMPDYLILDNTGGVDWSTNETIHITAIS